MTFFAPASRCLRASRGLGEPAGRLDHHVDPEVAPRQRGRVALGQHADLCVPPATIAVAGRGHVKVQGAQHGVVLEQVRERVGVAQVVRGDDLDARGPGLGVHGPPEVPPDPAESVDAHADGHGCVLLVMSVHPV